MSAAEAAPALGPRRPLADVCVLAVEQYGAGPFGSMLLADLGARVIKIEDPTSGGDVGRHVPPFDKHPDNGSGNLFFESLNRNKESIALDLRNDSGQQLFRQLVASADAVYCNLRGDVPEQLGLTYESLRHVNPQVVCCSLSAFGREGPMRTQPGYDYVLQGLAGWMSLTGEPDGPPTKSGLSVVDFSSGISAALALVSGIHAARRDGLGMDCDIALYDVAISMLNYLGTWHLTAGYEPRRTASSAHPTIVPFQNFETADGWIVLGCAKEKFWHRLVQVLDRPELADDPRFADFAARSKNSVELLAILSQTVRTHKSSDLLESLREAGVPCAPILTVPEALRHPMIESRKMIVSYPHPQWNTVRALASPLKVGNNPASPHPAPGLGEDVESICADLLQLSPAEVESYRAAGAFGAHGGHGHE